MRVQLYLEDGEGRLGCEAEGGGEDGAVSASCTVEQITAMVGAGLSDEQVRAACP